jgi:hypothetical protein
MKEKYNTKTTKTPKARVGKRNETFLFSAFFCMLSRKKTMARFLARAKTEE